MRLENRLATAAIAALALLAPRPAVASHPGAYAHAKLKGKVVHVSDGDTLVVDTGPKSVRVRLYGVDAPESKQRFGKDAKGTTVKLALDQVVEVEVMTRDMYGRSVGIVKLPDGRILQEELLKEGDAWLYRRYVKDPQRTAWDKLEDAARSAHRGLWQDAHPTPPWEWRRKH